MPGEKSARPSGSKPVGAPADRGYRGSARDLSGDQQARSIEALARVPVDWQPRDEPLAPLAVVARGPAARALALRIARLDDAALARLRGVAGPSLLIALGERDALPWVDGVGYLGRDPRAPSLLVPTASTPTVPIALLERALLGRAGAMAPPLAVLIDPPAIAGVGAARPITHEHLRAWIEAHRPPDLEAR